MTMRLTITNEDLARTARVSTVDFSGTPSEAVSMTEDIPPGEQRDFWIHHGRKLSVEELQVEAAPVEPPPAG